MPVEVMNHGDVDCTQLTRRGAPRPARARRRTGPSTEAEVRAILEEAVKPEGRVRLGSLLADLGRRAELTDEDFAAFAQRETTAAQPMTFER